MELISILAIIIFAAAVFLIYKLTKVVIKTILLSLALLAIISFVFGFFVYRDVTELKQKFPTSEHTFLLEIDNKIEAGVVATFAEQVNTPKLLDSAQLADINSAYSKKDFNAMLGSSYKLFIVKEEAFNSVQQVTSDEKNYTKEYLFKLLKSETPVDDYIADEAASQPEEMREQFIKEARSKFNMTDAQFKGLLFAMLLQSAMKQGPIFLVITFKDGDIMLYPETITFKALKLIPRPLLIKIDSIVGG